MMVDFPRWASTPNFLKTRNKRYKLFFAIGKVILGIVIVMMPNFCIGQFSQDSVPAFDSVTVENDQDIDSTFFVVLNRWGVAINLPRAETDSVWNHWSHIPAFADDKFYYTTGNTGSPGMSAYWEPNRTVGFDHGIHHLDLYRLNSDRIKYYSTDRAYTSIHYNQTPQQTKSGTNLKFGRAFDTKSGISIQYDRINDLGEFTHQKTRQTSLGVGMYYLPKPNKKFFFSYISNNFTLEENGGITDAAFLLDPIYEDRQLVPIWLTRSLAELKEREARLTNSWNIGNKIDTTARGFSLLYDGSYRSFQYKYSDPDSFKAFYDQYQVHEDGVRGFLSNKRLSNKLGIAIDYGTKSAFDGKLAAHLEHRFNRYTQDFRTEDITNLLLHGVFEQQLSNKLYFRGNLILDLGAQRGDYLFNGSIHLKPTQKINLSGHLISQLKTATGIQDEFRTLHAEVFSNSFKPTKYNTIGGKIEHGGLGLSGELNNTLVTDYVYFNDGLSFENISSSFNILQIKLGLTKKLGALYTENYIYFQNSSSSQVPLPTYFSKHYLGAKWRLFKKRLQLDTGVDAKILPDFNGYGYFPLAGQFYPSNSTIPYQYTLNGIIGLRVDQFNVYFKLENMHTLWDDTPRFLTQDHPLYDFRLRIGFRWLLRG